MRKWWISTSLLLAVVAAGCKRAAAPGAGAASRALELTDVAPMAGAQIDSTAVLFTCKTSVDAACTVHLRRGGDDRSTADYRDQPCREHRIAVAGLAGGSEYTFEVEAASGGASVRSAPRTFTVRRLQALVFTDHQPKFSIRRDYDQRGEVRVQNVDNRAHEVRVTALEVPGEIVVGVVGPGSGDAGTSLVLQPGEIRAVRLMLYAPGARSREYHFKIALRDVEGGGGGDAGGDAAADFDTARVDVNVQMPAFDVAMAADEAARSAGTLALPLSVTNNGEDISDFSLELDEALRNRVEVAPSYDGFVLRRAQTAGALLSPILTPGFAKLEGDVIARGAGQEKRLHVSFAAPVGKRVYLAFGDPARDDATRGGGCTNKGKHETPGPSSGGGGGTPPMGGGGGGGGDGPNPPPPSDDDGDEVGTSTRHRITRRAVLDFLPHLAVESLDAPARLMRPPFTYTAWHAPAGAAAGQQIFFSTEPYPGKTVAVTADGMGNQWPDIGQLPSGALLLTWERRQPAAAADGQAEIVVAASSDGGAMWGRPIVVGEKAADLYNPILVSGSGGSVYCIWQSGNDFVLRATTDGAAFGPRLVAGNAPGARAWWHQLAVGANGDLVLAYAMVDAVGRRIVARSSHDGGATWSAPGDVSAAGDVGEPNLLALANGTMLLVWRRDSGAIEGARSEDAGAHWSTPMSIVSGLAMAEHPRLSSDAMGGIRLSYLTSRGNRLRGVSRALDAKLVAGDEPVDTYDQRIEALLGRVDISLGDVRGSIAGAGPRGGTGSHQPDRSVFSFTHPAVVKTAASARFLWHNGRGGNGRILYAALGPGHKLLAAPMAINPVTMSGFWPAAAALGDGSLVVAYVTGGGQIAMQVVDSGHHASSPEVLPSHAAMAPAVAGAGLRRAVAWREGGALRVKLDDVLWTAVEQGAAGTPALAIDREGTLHIAYGTEAGMVMLTGSRDGKVWEAPVKLAEGGRDPSLLCDAGGVTWVAYESGAGGISVRRKPAGGVWSDPAPGATTSGYAERPALLEAGERTCLAFHAPSVNERLTIDSLFLTDREEGDRWSAEPRRTISLEPNISNVFLTINFGLKHERNIYHDHDTHLLVNGTLVRSLMRQVPEGRYITPISPGLLDYVATGTATNHYTLKVERINRGNYLMAYDYAMTTDYRFTQRYVFAESQSAADALLRAAEAGTNHDQSNVGVYANELGPVPASPEAGQVIDLGWHVFNSGVRAAEGVKLQLFSSPPTASGGGFTGAALGDVVDLGRIGPMEGITRHISFKCPKDLERAYAAVWSADKDFDPGNNVMSVTFRIDAKESPIATLPQGDLAPRSAMALEILAGRESVKPSDVAVSVFPAGNRLSSVLDADGAGPYALRPFTYDVRVRYLRSPEPVEVWASGIKVEAGSTAKASVQLPIGEFEFDFKPALGETASVEIARAGVRGGVVTHTLTGEAPTHVLKFPAGKYDLRLSISGGAPTLEKRVEGLELAAGQKLRVPLELSTGAIGIRVEHPASAGNTFTCFASVYDQSKPAARRLIADVDVARPLFLPAGRYDVRLAHPFPAGDPLDVEEWHRDVVVEAGKMAAVALDLKTVEMHVTPMVAGGGNITRERAALYRSGEHARPMYSFPCDKSVTVAADFTYDLYCPAGPRSPWRYRVDPKAEPAVTIEAPVGVMRFKVTNDADGSNLVDAAELLSLPAEVHREGTDVNGAPSPFAALRDNPNYIMTPGEYDVRYRFTGYGPDAERWVRHLKVEPSRAVDVAVNVKLGYLQVQARDPRAGQLDAEVFLYPADDRVKRMMWRAERRPLALGETAAVVPGKYDALVRYPALGPSQDQWIKGLFVNGGELTTARLAATGAIGVMIVQPGGFSYGADLTAAVIEAVGSGGGGTSTFSAADRLVSAARVGEGVPLSPGFYDVTPALGGILVHSARRTNVEVRAEAQTGARFEVAGGEVEVAVRLPDGRAPEQAGIAVALVPLEGSLGGTASLGGSGMAFRGVVPAGQYRAVATLGGRAWAVKLAVVAGRLTRAELPIDAATLTFSARRADGLALSPKVEVFAAGTLDQPLLATAVMSQVVVAAGTYDVKFTVSTGEVRWKRGVAVAAGQTLAVAEEFAVRNLSVVAKAAALNESGAGFHVQIYKKNEAEPVGNFRLGSGAVVAPGTYDLLISPSSVSRQGIWQRDVVVDGAGPRQVEMDLAAGVAYVSTVPQSYAADGKAAVEVTVLKAGGTEAVAKGRAGEALLVPAGTYDLLVSHHGLFGQFEKRISGVTVTAGESTGRMLWLMDGVGTIHFHAYSTDLQGYTPSPKVSVLSDGKTAAVANYAEELSLMPGRHQLTVTSGVELHGLPVALPEVEVFAGVERAIDVPTSIGGLVVLTSGGRPRPIRLTPHGDRQTTLLKGWSNSYITAAAGAYDVWVDSLGWAESVTVAGSTMTVVEKR
jgi:hypothetical protein